LQGGRQTQANRVGKQVFAQQKNILCKSFSLFPFGLTSAACGSVIVPPQEPVLSAGGLNSLITI